MITANLSGVKRISFSPHTSASLWLVVGETHTEWFFGMVYPHTSYKIKLQPTIWWGTRWKQVHKYHTSLHTSYTSFGSCIGKGHVNSIPTIQFFTGISRNTQSKLYMLSLTECAWDFQNNALWDSHQHALFSVIITIYKYWYLTVYSAPHLSPVSTLSKSYLIICIQNPAIIITNYMCLIRIALSWLGKPKM